MSFFVGLAVMGWLTMIGLCAFGRIPVSEVFGTLRRFCILILTLFLPPWKTPAKLREIHALIGPNPDPRVGLMLISWLGPFLTIWCILVALGPSASRENEPAQKETPTIVRSE